jgi:hypothetical protein
VIRKHVSSVSHGPLACPTAAIPRPLLSGSRSMLFVGQSAFRNHATGRPFTRRDGDVNGWRARDIYHGRRFWLSVCRPMQVCRDAGAAGKCCPAAPRASAQQAALLNEFASAWLQNARDYLAQGPWRTSAAKREHGKLCPSLCALSRVCGPERRLRTFSGTLCMSGCAGLVRNSTGSQF